MRIKSVLINKTHDTIVMRFIIYYSFFIIYYISAI